jgi:hypothetical protein
LIHVAEAALELPDLYGGEGQRLLEVPHFDPELVRLSLALLDLELHLFQVVG